MLLSILVLIPIVLRTYFYTPHGNVRLRNGSRKVHIGEKKVRVELDGATEKSRNFPKNGLVRAIDVYARASNF